MKRLGFFVTTAAVIAGFVIAGIARPAPAAAFTANNLLGDSVFDNLGTIAPTRSDPWSGIDDFLSKYPSSCISYNNGFMAPDPTGYSPTTGFTYGGNVSAGKVIYDASQAYGINPQVLLVTLQKEQSLVTGGAGCSVLAYTAAAGYGCPDGGTTYNYSGANLYTLNGTTVTSVTGTCVNTIYKAGFSQQVIRAAWLLTFGRQRSEGNISWAVIKGNWNNSDDPQTCYGGPMTQGTYQVCPGGPSTYYDGYTTIDGQSVHMDNGATAALYWYTPHFAGNQNFDNIFSSWFGNPYGIPYSASFRGESTPALTLNQNAKPTIYFDLQNTGNNFWKDTASQLSYYPVTKLAGTWPINRVSVFNDPTWPAANRPVATFTHVYNNDGTDASDQHTVWPNQYARFQFVLNNPTGIIPGTYQEHFTLVEDGVPNWWVPGSDVWVSVTVPAPFQASFRGESTGAASISLSSGQTASVYFDFQNTGFQFWKDDSSAPSYYSKTRLATTWPINRASSFYDSATDLTNPPWLSVSRPVNNFSHVYNSDGSDASDQHTVWPGQYARFQFTLKDPGVAAGFYQENFELVQDGAAAWWVPGGYAWAGVNAQ